jgi:hypothetical protein
MQLVDLRAMSFSRTNVADASCLIPVKAVIISMVQCRLAGNENSKPESWIINHPHRLQLKNLYPKCVIIVLQNNSRQVAASLLLTASRSCVSLLVVLCSVRHWYWNRGKERKVNFSRLQTKHCLGDQNWTSYIWYTSVSQGVMPNLAAKSQRYRPVRTCEI